MQNKKDGHNNPSFFRSTAFSGRPLLLIH